MQRAPGMLGAWLRAEAPAEYGWRTGRRGPPSRIHAFACVDPIGIRTRVLALRAIRRAREQHWFTRLVVLHVCAPAPNNFSALQNCLSSLSGAVPLA